MQSKTLADQIERLKTRFGDRAFDEESIQLVRREVINMADQEFIFLVDGLIATRPYTKAPLISDFRDARLKIEKRILEANLAGAAKAMNIPWSGGLKAYLAKEFPGCKTLNEAVAVRKLQIQVTRAENPKYNPMCDKKWMGEYAWEESPSDNGHDPKGAA